jgi:inositol 1,4,5-triphosphate receptor type 1/inositol 1,4,5-triphosphate receptor type 3
MKDRPTLHHQGHGHMQVKQEFDFSAESQVDNPHYRDEPFIYHTRLLEVLYNCTIGVEGMLQNETRLR